MSVAAPPVPLVALIGLLGLVIGSFLNVLVYRVPREESIAFPPSHCTTCQTPIKRRHNVPVFGWILLRGRCASCAEHISVRYPLVEAGTAALFAAITIRFGLSAQLPAYLFLAAVGLTLALIDEDEHRLPNSILLPAYIVGILLLVPATAQNGDWHSCLRAAAGMAALAGIYFMLGLAYPPIINFGVVGLAGLFGLFLGWLSLAAVMVGAVGSILLAIGGRALSASRTRGMALTLGPAIAVAAGAALFVTTPLVHWYGSLIGSA
jgi:leader peptidase (prepilin peptidase)/N-methyltransferase